MPDLESESDDDDPLAYDRSADSRFWGSWEEFAGEVMHSYYALLARIGKRHPNRFRKEFAMPKSNTSFTQHRDKLAESPPINALVARPVGKKEIQQQPKARAAVRAEWDRLRQRKCWE